MVKPYYVVAKKIGPNLFTYWAKWNDNGAGYGHNWVDNVADAIKFDSSEHAATMSAGIQGHIELHKVDTKTYGM